MIIADMFARLSLRANKGTFDAAGRAIEKVKDQLKELALAYAGVAAATAAVKDFLAFDDALTRLDIASAGAIGSVDQFRDTVLDASDETGIAKEQVLGAAAAYVRLTGDGNTATESLEVFAKTARATGAASEELGGTAAAMAQQFGLGAKDFERGFSMMIRAGKAGSVELKDLASVLPELGGLATQFKGGKGLEGLADLTAALQVVAVGTGGNANKARTQVQALYSTILSKSRKFKGVKVFETVDGVKRARNFRDIINDIARSDLAKDPGRLTEAFGSVEAFNAFNSLTRDGGKAWNEIATAQRGANDVAEDYAKYQVSLSARISRTWNKLKNIVTRANYWIGKHFTLIKIVIASALAVLIAFKLEAIAAALATAAAWAGAALPFILITALVAALALIVQDLWSAFNGGDSVLKDLWNSVSKYLTWDKLFDAIRSGLAKVLAGLGEIGAKIADKLGIPTKFLLSREGGIQSVYEEGGAGHAVAQANLARRQASNRVKFADGVNAFAQGMGAFAGPGADAVRAAVATPAVREKHRAATVNQVTTNHINVTVPPGTDADGVAKAVDAKLREREDSAARRLAGGAGIGAVR